MRLAFLNYSLTFPCLLQYYSTRAAACHRKPINSIIHAGWVESCLVASRADQFIRSREDSIEHRLCELAREGVLLARVKRGDQCYAAFQMAFGKVAELRLRGAPLSCARRIIRIRLLHSDRSNRRVEGELAERNDHSHGTEQLKLAQQVRAAICDLIGQWLIVGRGGMDDLPDVAVAQPKPVAAM